MAKIIGNPIPNMPWEAKPEGCTEPIWRYSGNPIIGRNGNSRSNSVFNSAVVPYQDGFAGVFRCDSRSISMDLFPGFSKDGLHWKIDDETVHMTGAEPEILAREYRYDARITPLEGRYYITWCNGYHGPTIGVAWTEDFRTFHQLENAFLPYNRNGVLTTCNGFVYRMGCALLDLEQPWKVLYRTKDYILAPWELYECVGDVPNVTFPCAALADAATGRIAVYYGCADTVTGLAFTTADELISFMKTHNLEA